MTVTYTLKVSNANLCGFAKLLGRWRGSIYKLLYREILIFIALYYSLSLLYRYLLTGEQRRIFEKIALYCDEYTELIPMSFVLGFYVSIVVGRWWQQFMSIPWPDRASILIASHVHGGDERSRIIRRTLARYLNLMMALTLMSVSTSVKKRFPTLDHIVEAGLMTLEEKMAYENTPSSHGKWWYPSCWFSALAVRARKEGRIKEDIYLRQLLDEMLSFRGNCGMLFNYDWISIPLVYTQVVTIALYTFFFATLMGRQYLDPEMGYKHHEVDLYIPIFTILQFFFYMGWLKVAEQLINPLGEDDDDFELNWCMDRGIQVALLIVDELYMKHPKLVKDSFWDEIDPQLPYTKSSIALRTQPHLGSTANLNIDPQEAAFVPMNTIMEEDCDDMQYHSPPSTPTPFRDYLAPEFPLGSKRGSVNSLQSIKRSFLDLRLPFGRKNSNTDLPTHGEKVALEYSNGRVLSVFGSQDSERSLKRNSSHGLTLNIKSAAPSPTLSHKEYDGLRMNDFAISVPSTPTDSIKSFKFLRKPDLINAREEEQKRFLVTEVWEPQLPESTTNQVLSANQALSATESSASGDTETRSEGVKEVLSRLPSAILDPLPPVLEVPEVDSNQSTVNSVTELIRPEK